MSLDDASSTSNLSSEGSGSRPGTASSSSSSRPLAPSRNALRTAGKDFWTVLRQNRPVVTEQEGEQEEGRNLRLANAARDILVEQRVVKLFMKVDKLRGKQETTPTIPEF